MQGDIATNNDNVPIDLLFTHNECEVYRFHDAGHYRYFTTCPRSAVSWQWQQCQQNGKTRSCTNHLDEVATVEREND